MDEFIGEFVADTRDGFDHIRNDLALWALDPHNRAALDAVFRFVHTVRGNCGFLKFARFEHLCVPAEAVLADIRSGKRAADNNLVAALICVIERIGMLADAIEAGTGLSAADEHDMIARRRRSGAQSGCAGITPPCSARTHHPAFCSAI
jgi:two-component system, chemotaxis family, sensor kinase CheA